MDVTTSVFFTKRGDSRIEHIQYTNYISRPIQVPTSNKAELVESPTKREGAQAPTYHVFALSVLCAQLEDACFQVGHRVDHATAFDGQYEVGALRRPFEPRLEAGQVSVDRK